MGNATQTRAHARALDEYDPYLAAHRDLAETMRRARDGIAALAARPIPVSTPDGLVWPNEGENA